MTVGPLSRISPGSPSGTVGAVTVDDAHLHAGSRCADRGGDGLGRVAGLGRRGGAGFGQPVADEHTLEGQLVHDAADQRHRDVRCAGDGDPQARQVVRGVAGGALEERLVEGRGARQHGDALAFDRLEDRVDVEHGHRVHGQAGGHRGQDARLEPEHVEVRVDHQVAVAVADAGHGHPVAGHAHRPAVGLHDTLGHTGRARGEQDVARILRCDRRRPPVELGPVVVGDGAQQVLPGVGSLCGRTVDDHDRVELRQVDRRGAQHRDVVGTEEVGRREQHAGPAAREHDRRLVALEACVDRHQRRPGGAQPEDRDDPPQRVRRPDRHPVTRPDAGVHERRADVADQLTERRVGEGDTLRDDRDGVPVSGDRRGERCGDRHRCRCTAWFGHVGCSSAGCRAIHRSLSSRRSALPDGSLGIAATRSTLRRRL